MGRCSALRMAVTTSAATEARIMWSLCGRLRHGLVGGGEHVTWASVYSSETGAWSAVTSITIENGLHVEIMKPSLLIGDTLYFYLAESGMLKFDLGGRTLSVIVDTPGMYGAIPMMAEDGRLGFVAVLDDSIYTWSWKAGAHDLAKGKLALP
ncbi:hypothetical protein EJB05_14213, partial [Eragrostis curvula]